MSDWPPAEAALDDAAVPANPAMPGLYSKAFSILADLLTPAKAEGPGFEPPQAKQRKRPISLPKPPHLRNSKPKGEASPPTTTPCPKSATTDATAISRLESATLGTAVRAMPELKAGELGLGFVSFYIPYKDLKMSGYDS